MMDVLTLRKRGSFTLVELVIVIVIIGLIGSVLAGVIASVTYAMTYVVNYMRAVTIADDILDTIIEGDENVPGIRFAEKILTVLYRDGGYFIGGQARYHPDFGGPEDQLRGLYRYWDTAQDITPYPTDSAGISYIVGWPRKTDMMVVHIRAQEMSTIETSAGTAINRCRLMRRHTNRGASIATLWDGNEWVLHGPNAFDTDNPTNSPYENMPYYYSDAEITIENPDFSFNNPTFYNAPFNFNQREFDPNVVMALPNTVFDDRGQASLAVRIRVKVGNASYATARSVAVCYNGWPITNERIER